VVTEAAAWIGTPFHHAARVKGPAGGVDCAMLLAEVYVAAGVREAPIAAPFYTPDFFLHSREERFLGEVLTYAAEVAEPLPADVALFKLGHVFAHGAIVVDWPVIIHAQYGARVMRDDASLSARLRPPRPVRFFRPFALIETEGFADAA
jgi:cell wall-associated NlpC family hydrolase